MRRAFLFVHMAVSIWAGSISGVAVDATGAVIPHTKIVAISESGDRKEAKSDDYGRFAILDLKPGTYAIEISSAGFLTRKIDSVRVNVEEETRLPAIELAIAAVGGCEGPFPAVARFTPMSSGAPQLSGRVYLVANKRASGVLVTLYEVKNGPRVASSRADANGDFIMPGLRPGFYNLRVHLPGYADLMIDAVEIRRGYRSDAGNFSLTPCSLKTPCPAIKWIPQVLCL